MPYKFPLAFDSWDEDEKNEIYKIVESGFFTMGDKVKSFEKEFASYIGSKNAVMVNSGFVPSSTVKVLSPLSTIDNEEEVIVVSPLASSK